MKTADQEVPKPIVYDSFDEGPGRWQVGKDLDESAPEDKKTYHRSILGKRGTGAPLTWSKSGGRSGGTFRPNRPGTLTIIMANSIGLTSSRKTLGSPRKISATRR